MSKLTAERCRQLISQLSFERDNQGMSNQKYDYLEALEISLPLLEQQAHEKSIIAEQLEAVRDSLSLTPHQNAVISCAIDRLNLLTARTLELSRSLIKQQEKVDDGWIEWGGGRPPVKPDVMVCVRYRKGKEKEPDTAGHYYWNHTNSPVDIIAYRVIENDGREG